MRRLLLPVAAILLAVACADGTGPSATTSSSAVADVSRPEGAAPIRVYQQNVYPGFDIDAVVDGVIQTQITGDPSYLLGALATGLATLDNTNWRERATRMVDEIEAQNPDVVSLNEMVTVSRQNLALVGLPIADGSVDFLAVFREELAARGLPYKLVDSLPLTYAPLDLGALFGLAPPGTIYATYYDRDALFVRQNVGVANVVADTFAVALDEVVRQTRGFIAADLTLRGKAWRFIATHPEPSFPAAAGQPTHIQEILAAAGGTALPVVIAGDLNLLPTSAEHAQLVGAGFIDLLQEQYGTGAAGYTCCQSDPGLRNPSPTLVKRIDYVMVRPAEGYKLGPMDIQVFGDEPSERTSTGMWPSDHAGLFAKLVLQKDGAR